MLYPQETFLYRLWTSPSSINAWAVVVFLAGAVYPNFYGFWSEFNYINDRFFFFTRG